MSWHRWKGPAALLLLILFIFQAIFWKAGTRAQEPGRAGSEAIAVIMVIDTSGSMARTDPGRLRESAARIFIDLLSPEDYLGIILTYDYRAEVVVPLQKAGDSVDRQGHMDTLSPRLNPRGDTHSISALEAALEQFRNTSIGGRKPVVVFLTDGDPAPGSRRRDTVFMREYMQSFWSLVSTYARERIPIYTVGFSDEVDPEAIRRVSEDTRGEYFILPEASGLPVTFFEVLGKLKNRRVFLEESPALGTEEKTFHFTVNEHTRQVNLVVVSDRDFRAALVPPRGSPGDTEELVVIQREGYMMGVLTRPSEEHYGTWELRVSGRGEAKVLGSIDYHFQIWLDEPAPSSQHPLHEPMHIKVRVDRDEFSPDSDLRVVASVARPGGHRPAVVPLTEENGYFTGIFDQVDRVGNYELVVQVLLDSEYLFEISSKVFVKLIPSLETDFWIEGGNARIGEELTLTASLRAGGERLREGSQLGVDSFAFLFHYEEGERLNIPLYDSGDPDHGDVRALDGIWSNRHEFDREGSVSAVLQVTGRYRDNDFFLEKDLGSFMVLPPGRVLVSALTVEPWAVPGSRFPLSLKVENESHLRETLVISYGGDFANMKDARLILEPGESRDVSLEIDVADNAPTGSYLLLPLRFGIESGETEVAPEHLEFQVEMVTRGEALKRDLLSGGPVLILAVLIVLLALAVLFFLAGLALYGFYLHPRLKVSGYLNYRVAGEPGPAAGQDILGPGIMELTADWSNRLRLRNANSKRVVISLDPKNNRADFNVEGSRFRHDLVIINRWEHEKLPAFLQGWKAFLKRPPVIETAVECTRPGVMDFKGAVTTRSRLYHGSQFESGGIRFLYTNYGRDAGKKADGVNVLEDKW